MRGKFPALMAATAQKRNNQEDSALPLKRKRVPDDRGFAQQKLMLAQVN